ncbi:PHT4 [Symbiodinium natans]|uniref:PHT4 protein n=1 Tax=Symbiodinium natans TaxID=878477 RepID=A0A812VAD6_9DINO|nr:PHT4 [Symbiodinium natans]
MRNALSPLLVFMAAELDLTTSQKGNLLSAIAAGYFFTQVPGGVLADWLGAKNVMTAALTLSALCCLLLPVVVDSLGLSGLWGVMAVMGAVQGPLFPTSTVYLSKWMPKAAPGGSDEKAWGTGMLDIGTSLGALLVIPAANSLAGTFGWRLAYQSIGAASLGFVGIWQVMAAEEPGRCFYISKTELAFLEANVPKQKPKSKDQQQDQDGSGLLGMPLALALHQGLWAVFFAHIAFNYGAYYLTNWSPTYYSEVLNLTPAQAKYHLMLPHVTNLICKSVNPLLVRVVERNGVSLLSMRRLFTVSGFVLAAACLLPVYRLRNHDPWISTILCSMANACFGLAPCGFKANYLDITEKYVGVISGYGNTLGTVGSWVGPQLVAFLLHRFQSWDVVLLSVALVNVGAALNYVRCSTVTPLERSLQTPTKKAADPKTN